jgi:hypothetical protein
MIKATTIEDIILYLTKHGIKTDYQDGIDGHFNRFIEFEIEGNKYYIQWWINESYLYLSKNEGSARIPFKYIGINPYSPTQYHKFQLCFFYEKDIMRPDRIPWGSFKIPFNDIH